MIKTLYTRVVLIVVAINFLSLVAGFMISASFFKPRLMGDLVEENVSAGKDYIELLKNEGFEKTAQTDHSIFHRLYNISVFENPNMNPSRDPWKTKDGLLYSVRASGDPNDVRVTMPFRMDNGSYYLVIQKKDNGRINPFLATTLGIVFLLGSSMILFSTRYIVKPLTKLREATKRIATGNYNISLQVRRKDEIGELANQFQMMAKELQSMEERRQEFISNVSHEFQSPLTSISGFAAILLEDGISDAERSRYLKIIRSEGQRLSKLNKDLLTLTFLDANGDGLARNEYALDEQLRHVVITLMPLWKERNIEIHLSLTPMDVFADQHQMVHVWSNLIHNGIKYTDTGGEIFIANRQTKQETIVEITDTGVGISKEELPHIFRSFYRIDKSRNRSSEGSGLGLSIARKIVILHGGNIDVQSEIGQGTTFTVRLPNLQLP